MKKVRNNTLVSIALGSALAVTSMSAAAGHCAKGKMYGGHHPGMGHGMYGHHKGMGYPMKKYYGHPHGYSMKGGSGYGKGGYNSGGYQAPSKEASPATTQQSAASSSAPDIVSIAAGSDDFETLVTAVKAAGLADTLAQNGPFTVFAPTDDAFAKLPVEQLAALLADKEALTRVLTYHVVPGTVSADAVSKLSSAKTVEGGSLTIDTTDGVSL